MARIPLRGLFSFLFFSMLFFLVPQPVVAAEEDNLEIALNLATMLQSGRSVIAENQTLINDPSIGDKGLTGEIVRKKALEKYSSLTGGQLPDFEATDLESRLLKVQVDSIVVVMNDNQMTINQKGVAFKGFVPAVFARLVNEEFKRKIGQEAEIKVTAPPELVRNRKARPDDWEIEAIRNDLQSPEWVKGSNFWGMAEKNGRVAFRVLVPEYYGQGCLSCHGAPKGEFDITGYPKEGGKLGDLGGVISVTLYQQ
jgi:Protein of unknown function (DUF3365)